jgi:hypothetical protein
MPQKSEEEIYELTIEWYKQNFLIDEDDWPELKKSIQDQEGYQQKINKQIQSVKCPEIPVFWSDFIDDQPL